jgi:hypothetical protein
MPELDAGAIVRILNRHRVRYVVIGGLAAQVHDLPIPATVDIDVTPANDHANLERLAAAFDDLEANLYTADNAGTWFPRTPVESWARYNTLHLISRHGPIDIVFAPDGAPHGFVDLAEHAEQHTIEDEPALVITVEMWAELKQASGRAKDLEHLDRYYESRSGHDGSS